MQERINRLRDDIVRLRENARHCDPDIRRNLLGLADEMQTAVDEMEQKLRAAGGQLVGASSDNHGPHDLRLAHDRESSERHQRIGKLLLVDDETTLRTLIAEFLEEEGFEVVQAFNCMAALKRLESDPEIKCILSDVRMPDGTGFELAEKALERWPDTKIALISGFSEPLPPSLARRGVQLFRKPLPIADVAMHVKDLCRSED